MEPTIICTLCYLVLVCFLGFNAWRKFRFTSRPLIISAWIFVPLTLGLSALLTWMMDVYLLPLALELSAGILLSFAHPVFAASFFLATFLIKPWELMPPNELMQIFPKTLAALTFASLAIHFLGKRSTSVSFNRPIALFFAYMFWVLLSAITAYNSLEATSLFGASMFPVLAAFLLIINSCEERLDLEIIRGSLIIAVITLSLIGFIKTLSSWDFEFSRPIPRLEGQGQWANANDLAALMVLIGPLIFYPLILRSRSTLNRLVGVLLTIYLLAGIWLSQSRGAMMAIMLGVLTHFAITYKVKTKLIIPAAAVLLVGLIAINSLNRDVSDLSGSNSMRFEYMMTGLRMLKSNPVTGVGFENYDDLYEKFTTRFDEYGVRTAHSSWVLAMAESGVPGLILLIWLCISVIRKAFKIRYLLPELIIASASYLVCMSLLSHTYQLAPYILFALIISASRVINMTTLTIPARESEDD